METKALTQCERGPAPRTHTNSSVIPFPRAKLIFLAVIIVGGIAVWRGEISRRSLSATHNNTSLAENEIDAALQRAAAAALGQQEGTIIVVDPQTGRVRAVVNPQIAFENAYAPGSTIKPFTALAALRAGLIDKNSTTLCRERYARKDFSTVCAHPRDLPPFNPAEAIAYSCNYYFGTLGERLNEALLSDTLSSFGFGKPVFAEGRSNHAGQLLRGKGDPRNSLGEGDHLQATPIQLVMAYAALVNGGHLLTPRVAASSEFQVSERARLQIAAEHRAIVLEGMRGAVVYGTAARAGLNSRSMSVFGKTGTSTPMKGFRTQGWFVGFAATSDGTGLSNDSQPSPADIHLAVLVFLKRAHGANAAALSRGIFEEYERVRTDAETGRHGDAGTSNESSAIPGTKILTPDVSASPRLPVPASVLPTSPLLPVPASPLPRVAVSGFAVRVHQVTENVTRELSLGDYVLGVVAAEGSMEDQREALKALAVAARTYAVRNAGRHVHDGFDFCSTTHCQRFIAANDRAQLRPTIIDAVKQTAGEVLRDEAGETVEAYFSASCGGVTANIQTLWGTRAPAYLRGVHDQSCTTMPHHSWTDVISAQQLLMALRSDPRTDPGDTLNGLQVSRRDATGRAEKIVIEGERSRTVSGWDFKIIVGRKLGWNLLKSSRFAVARSGSNFIFRGSGFGHGLGLCQEGGHVMAQRGVNYRQILAKYFPGTRVSQVARDRIAELPRDQNGIAQRNVLAQKNPLPALPPDSAVRLCLTDQLLSYSSEATPRNGGIASDSNWYLPERHSLSALCGGKAAENPDDQRIGADLIWNSGSLVTNTRPSKSSKRTSLSSEHFRVSYPVTLSQREAEGVLKTLETTRANLLRRISAAGLFLNQIPTTDIFLNATTGDFVGRTGQPWWAAAATKGNLIELQPAETLKRRRVLDTTLRHELVHILIDKLSRGRAPRWLAEGAALYFAGEGPLVKRYAARGKMSIKEIDDRLTNTSSADEMRRAYAAAYGEVSGLVRSNGEASVWRRIAAGSTSP
jgi:SpoIID/LytB domain protein